MVARSGSANWQKYDPQTVIKNGKVDHGASALRNLKSLWRAEEIGFDKESNLPDTELTFGLFDPLDALYNGAKNGKLLGGIILCAIECVATPVSMLKNLSDAIVHGMAGSVEYMMEEDSSSLWDAP